MAFRLQPNPTFKAKVKIPVPGQARSSEVEFEFRHFSQSDFDGMMQEKSVRDTLTDDVIVGWSGVDTPFSTEALKQLFDNYPGAGAVVFQTFVDELFTDKAKVKNS